MVERDKTKKRRIGFLLSGGLDSSIVAAVGAEIAKERGEKIATFAIGFKDSPDLLAAREVAKHIGSDHTEYVETEETMLNLLEKTPLIIESFCITTNRASDWQHKLALNIQRDFPDIKVIMGGDGADETSCGYRDCYRAPDAKAAHSHTIRRLREIHYYDVTRFDLSVARCGQEARTPHLDDDLVEYILSIDPELRIPLEAKNGEFKGKMEKLIWREAFKDYLPLSIVYRRKEAFSDGVSLLERSWFVIVREHFDKIISDKEFEENKDKFKYCPPTTKEAYHYRKVFESRFGKENERCIPGFWLQEWSPETKGDPSARTMSIY
jgi:asparagine synthase (glutamine-hydrolysing)